MSPRPLLILTAILVAVQSAVSTWVLTQVDRSARVPIHWNIEGRPDGYAEAWTAMVMLPAATLGLGLLLAYLPRFDPRRENLERSATAYRWIVGSGLTLMSGVHLLVAASALGNQVSFEPYLGLGFGVMFVVIGNFLGKTRSSWFLGIRTPWTLSSERSWQQTHRLGGYLFMASGLVVMLTALILPFQFFMWAILGGSIGSIAVLVVYSYLVWRNDPDRTTL